MMEDDRTKQKTVFLNDEGDNWYHRNRTYLHTVSAKDETDPVIRTVKNLQIPVQNTLEIGAADGWRLGVLRQLAPEAQLCGLEPSAQAVKEAVAGIQMKQGTAELLP